MRVLFCVYNYFPAASGGAERQARLQAEELSSRGYAVTVVCPRWPGMHDGFVGRVDVRRTRRLNVRYLKTPTHLAGLAWFLARNARRFDLVHVHLASLQAEVVVRICRLLRRPVYVKVACGGHVGDVLRHRRIVALTRYVGLRRATRVQALSEQIREELLGIGVDPVRIVSIPNGVDTSIFRPAAPGERRRFRRELSLPEDEVIVLYVGRFARYKGIFELLEAWQAVSPAAARLVLVGTPETHHSIGVPAEAEGILVREWTNSVLQYLQAADIFVYPSHADGMSNAILEAMACGLPILAARTPANQAVVSEGIQGLLFEPSAPTQLAARLRLLIDDESLRRRLGRGAHVASRRYAIQRVVDQLEREYAAILGCR